MNYEDISSYRYRKLLAGFSFTSFASHYESFIMKTHSGEPSHARDLCRLQFLSFQIDIDLFTIDGDLSRRIKYVEVKLRGRGRSTFNLEEAREAIDVNQVSCRRAT